MSHVDMVEVLEANGFDESTVLDSGVWVKCSQCEAMVINGVATHEIGCPHVKHSCRGCWNMVPAGVHYCEDCQ